MSAVVVVDLLRAAVYVDDWSQRFTFLAAAAAALGLEELAEEVAEFIPAGEELDNLIRKQRYELVREDRSHFDEELSETMKALARAFFKYYSVIAAALDRLGGVEATIAD